MYFENIVRYQDAIELNISTLCHVALKYFPNE